MVGGESRILLGESTAEVFPSQSTNPEVYGRVYSVIPSVYSVLNKKANMVASCPLRLYRVDTRTKQEVQHTTGIFADLLRNPNPYTTPTQLIKEIVLWKGLCGRAYVVLEKIKGVHYLSVLESPWVTVVADPETKVRAYIYSVGNKKYYYPSDVVAEISDFNPSDFYFGMSPLEAASIDVSAQIYTKKTYAAEMKKGNMSGGAITSDRSLDDTEIIKLKNEWKRRTPESSRVLFLPKNMTFVPFNESTGTTTKMREILNESFDAVALVYGMHPILFGHSNVARPDSIESIETHVWYSTILPEQQHIAEALTQRFAHIVNSSTYFEFFTDNVPALNRAKMEQTRVGVAEASLGKITVNEWRVASGLAPYIGVLADFGNTPMPVWEQAMMQIQAQTAAALAPTPTGPDGKPGPSASNNTSPSLPLVGSEGGRRDQSQTGEAQLPDETGKRSFDELDAVIQKTSDRLGKIFAEKIPDLVELLSLDEPADDDDDDENEVLD